jgi:hypothetical protein
MKNNLLLILSFGILFSCTRTYSPHQPATTINGDWRMITVTDRISGQEMSRPVSVTGDVEITFATSSATSGLFYGKTPSNLIYQNPFTTAQNYSLTIQELLMTKTQETNWGSAFVINILAAQNYRIDTNDRLHITTVSKELIFVRK